MGKHATRGKLSLIFGGVMLASFVLFGTTSDSPPAKVEQSPAAVPGVVKITDKVQRDSAIAKVEAVFDADYAKRWGYMLEPKDVYQNPKGIGLIVWMGEGFVYLVEGDSVYAVSGNAKILLPEAGQIPDAPNLTFTDLDSIRQDRAVDYERLYDACLAKVEQKDIAVPRGGLFDQQLEKELQKCKELQAR